MPRATSARDPMKIAPKIKSITILSTFDTVDIAGIRSNIYPDIGFCYFIGAAIAMLYYSDGQGHAVPCIIVH
jgi:hypothetical protein